MNKHVVVSSILAVSMASLVGCSSSSGTVTPEGDSGTGGSQDSSVTPAQDSSISSQDSAIPVQDSSVAGDTSVPPHGDASMGDGGVDANVTPPTATPVVLGNNLELWGVTDDGFAIYSDETAQILYALSLTATTPIALEMNLNGDAGGGFHNVSISHKVVFINVDGDGDGISTLSTWTSGAAAPTVVTTTSVGGLGGITASSDSSLVVYYDNFDGNQNADVVGATVTGTNPSTLKGAVNIGQDVCVPAASFAGTSSYLVLTHCKTGDTAGTISSYNAAASWNAIDLTKTAVSGFALDTAGTHVAFSDAAGLEVSPVTTATLKLLDANGIQAPFFNPAGTSVVYVTTTDGGTALATSTIATAAPTVLATGISAIYGLSPNGSTVLATETGNDIWLASATTAGAAQQAGTSQEDFVLGDLFTADSSHAFFVDFAPTNPSLNASPIAGGATPPVLTDNVYLADFTPSSYFAATTSKVVFGANPVSDNMSNGDGTTDILVADTATAAAPTLIANQANGDFYLTPAKDKIVYVWNFAAGSKAGLYITAVP